MKRPILNVQHGRGTNLVCVDRVRWDTRSLSKRVRANTMTPKTLGRALRNPLLHNAFASSRPLV